MKPTELKSVQERIIKYATGIGWQYVPRLESDKRRSTFAEASADKGNEEIYKSQPSQDATAWRRELYYARLMRS